MSVDTRDSTGAIARDIIIIRKSVLTIAGCHNSQCVVELNFSQKSPHSLKTLQELRMLSSVTINCQITKIVMNSGSQLSEL